MFEPLAYLAGLLTVLGLLLGGAVSSGGMLYSLSSCASKWFWEILLLQAGNPENSGSFQ